MENTQNEEFIGRVKSFREGLSALVKEYDIDIVATLNFQEYGLMPQVKFIDVKGIPEQPESTQPNQVVEPKASDITNA